MRDVRRHEPEYVVPPWKKWIAGVCAVVILYFALWAWMDYKYPKMRSETDKYWTKASLYLPWR